MVINVASFQYFGHFLAREMHALNHLGMLYTNLPAFKAFGIPKERLQWHPISLGPNIMKRVGMRWLGRRLNWAAIEYFDKWVAANLTQCDMFHCFSSYGLRAHCVARDKFGAMTVVERGSSHISFQDEIMKEEYGQWGVPYQPIDSRFVEKEIHEYEHHQKNEILELTTLYIDQGMIEQDAKKIVNILVKYKDLFIQSMVQLELGLDSNTQSNNEIIKSSIYTFLSFISFGLIPISPYFIGYFINNRNEFVIFIISTTLSAITLFCVGVFAGRITKQGLLKNGLFTSSSYNNVY